MCLSICGGGKERKEREEREVVFSIHKTISRILECHTRRHTTRTPFLYDRFLEKKKNGEDLRPEDRYLDAKMKSYEK